ncbi:MAG: diacylglycerol kinase family protein [Planctomycetaceae bacterium]
MAAASRQPSSSTWVIIQRNPSSGSGAGRRQLIVLSKELMRLGYRVRMFRNRPLMDEWLRDRSSKIAIRCLVAAGGDGTVADLSNRHPGIPIAILPMGTENLLARYLGLRRDGLQLAGVIHQNVVRVLDSALANGRRFLLMLSSGVDADVVAALHGKRTGNISRLNYLIPTVRAFFGSRVREFEVCSEDQANRLLGTHVIVTNIPRYGFQLEFSPDADPSDGLLDVRVCHCKTRWGIVWHAIRLKLGLQISASEFSTFRAASVRLVATSGGSDRSQCDGDPGPDLPVRVQVERGTLRLLVPNK